MKKSAVFLTAFQLADLPVHPHLNDRAAVFRKGKMNIAHPVCQCDPQNFKKSLIHTALPVLLLRKDLGNPHNKKGKQPELFSLSANVKL